MAAKGAIVPVYKLMKDADEPFDPKAYLGPVSGYYTDSKGNMLSFPFNSSTAIFYWNKDAFKKAGLDPNKPPKTWKEFLAVVDKLQASGQKCAYTTSWPSWVHIENFSAWHNKPIGTKENGMAGADTQFQINTPLHVRQLQMLGDLSKKGAFGYAGRTNQGGAKFTSGECAMLTESSSGLANTRRDAKFDWAVAEIPYWDDVAGAPQNAIIGGASLWVMGGKTNNAYKGVAKFFGFLSRPEIQMEWHTGTGYVPITNAAYELTKKSGYYEKNPGAEVAIKMLAKKPPTANSKGLRFGNYVQGREVIEEEMEGVFAGKKDAKSALDEAVKRGNEILRKFEAANKS
jgi:sn-glycerol 3-phosphate transport system substrate-binding protein